MRSGLNVSPPDVLETVTVVATGVAPTERIIAIDGYLDGKRHIRVATVHCNSLYNSYASEWSKGQLHNRDCL